MHYEHLLCRAYVLQKDDIHSIVSRFRWGRIQLFEEGFQKSIDPLIVWNLYTLGDNYGDYSRFLGPQPSAIPLKRGRDMSIKEDVARPEDEIWIAGAQIPRSDIKKYLGMLLDLSPLTLALVDQDTTEDTVLKLFTRKPRVKLSLDDAVARWPNLMTQKYELIHIEHRD